MPSETKREVTRRRPQLARGEQRVSVLPRCGRNDPKVKALVYVAAMQPDKRETMGGLNAKMQSAFDMKGVVATPNGFVTVTSDVFLHDGAQDLPIATANFPAATQMPITSAVYVAPTSDPAWKHKPAFGIVATEDRTVSLDLERWM